MNLTWMKILSSLIHRNSISLHPMKKVTIIFILLALSLIGYCPPLNKAVKGYNLYKAKQQTFLKAVLKRSLTLESLTEALYYMEVKHPEIVLKQALLESGHFTSALYRTNNNLFGMKRARQRETTATGQKRGYATYTHWSLSLKDYRLMQMYYEKKGQSMRDYYAFLLTIGYAQDKKYIEKLKSIK